jgi:hypothetical protein
LVSPASSVSTIGISPVLASPVSCSLRTIFLKGVEESFTQFNKLESWNAVGIDAHDGQVFDAGRMAQLVGGRNQDRDFMPDLILNALESISWWNTRAINRGEQYGCGVLTLYEFYLFFREVKAQRIGLHNEIQNMTVTKKKHGRKRGF